MGLGHREREREREDKWTGGSVCEGKEINFNVSLKIIWYIFLKKKRIYGYNLGANELTKHT